MEKTLVILKPDAVQRRFVGDIIERFERKGLKIIGLKLKVLTEAILNKHYKDHVGKSFYPELSRFMQSGPVVLLALEGPSAVSVVRTLMGPTDSSVAPAGTVRGDLSLSKGCNLIHGSDSVESARKELALFFSAKELVSYSVSDERWAK